MGRSSEGPLSNAVLYILLALAERDLHGYGIMQEARRLSGGKYKMGPGTLYDNLRALLAKGWVEELEAPGEGGGEPRRMYRLSPEGRAVLAREVERLAEVVRAGRSRLTEKTR